MDSSTFLKSGEKVRFSGHIAPESTVCIVDASFNPPHKAHVKLAQLCRKQFPDCVLVLMLSTGNADKPAVSPRELDQRTEMMRILSEQELPGVTLLALTTEARFIDKARAVADALPKSRAIFAMGFDTLVRLGDQKYYEEPVENALAPFFTDVEVLVLTREQDARSKMPDLGTLDEQKQLTSLKQFKPFAARIHTSVSDEDTLNISSSRARSSVEELVHTTPSNVAHYVRNHRLYGLEDESPSISKDKF